MELLGLSGSRTCRVLGKIWWIFLVMPDDAQPLSSSYISANWQHGLSQAQKPMSSALVRGPQHSSAPALLRLRLLMSKGPLTQHCWGPCSVAHPHHGRARVCCSQQGPCLCPALTAAMGSCVLSQAVLLKSCPTPAEKAHVCFSKESAEQ